MKAFLLYLLISITSAGTALQAAITVSGQIKSCPQKWLTISGYSDYISNATFTITQVMTDADGNFRVNIGNGYAPKIKLLIENRSVIIYVWQGGEYFINEVDDRLRVKDVAGPPVNQRLRDMNNELVNNSYPLFIDTLAKNLQLSMPVDSVLERIRLTESKYADHNDFTDAFLHYSAGSFKLVFLSLLPDARALLDQFENDYFNHHAIQTMNPFYTALLGDYLKERIYSMNNNRYKGNGPKDRLDQLKQEVAFFKDARLRELSMVAGLNQLLLSNRETADKQALTNRINKDVLHTIKDSLLQKTLARAVLINNRMKPGDPFPLLSLKNEKGVVIPFGDISSDLILVDVWATWCGVCIEGMKNFPAWMDQCGGRLTIVSISVDDDLAKMTQFLDKQTRLSQWVTLFNGRSGNYLDKLLIQGFPSYFILNKNKQIVAIPGSSESVSAHLKAAMQQ